MAPLGFCEAFQLEPRPPRTASTSTVSPRSTTLAGSSHSARKRSRRGCAPRDLARDFFDGADEPRGNPSSRVSRRSSAGRAQAGLEFLRGHDAGGGEVTLTRAQTRSDACA